jgi:hypothetical protein
MRSAKPSPLTSPADATDRPLSSSAATPLNLKPLPPSRLDKSMFAGEFSSADCHLEVGRAMLQTQCD